MLICHFLSLSSDPGYAAVSTGYGRDDHSPAATLQHTLGATPTSRCSIEPTLFEAATPYLIVCSSFCSDLPREAMKRPLR